jgi:hypothetical protein
VRLSELFHRFGQAYLDRYGDRMPPFHGKALHDIRQCRTSVMGGKRFDCPQCKAQQYAYHSCNNRHCPKCGGDKTEGWLKKQFDRLLPVPYFFATFTLPAAFREIFRSHQKICYALFFEASAQALKDVTANKRFVGGNIGFFGVLQTWTSELFYHPHLHYIIPGVGLSKNRKNWIKLKNKKFLAHVTPLGLRFKVLFQHALKKHPELYAQVPEKVWSREVKWVVHCEPAGYGREVIQYLAPYIFRTAMTDHRNLTLHEDGTVSFSYKDNQTGERKTCRPEALDLIGRFLQHVLPKGFVKIRYFGLMGANQGHLLKQLKWLILKSISQKEQAAFLAIVFKPRDRQMRCRCCGAVMVQTEILKPSRGP